MIKFSVLMSIYYKEKVHHIEECMNSLLNQTYPPSEIVIIKDGELTKELNEKLNFYKKQYPSLIKIYGYKENRGLWYALRYGVNRCIYDLIARMDIDDIARLDRFEKQIEVAKKYNLENFLIGSNVYEFNEDELVSKRIMPEKNEEIIKYSKKRNPFCHPSILTTKKAILNANNYDNYLYCEDYDLFIKMIKNEVETYNIQEELVYMRVNDEFYYRRGGLSYLKHILRFKNSMYKRKYINLFEYLITIIPSIIVCLLPNKLRALLYKKTLRSEAK